MKINKAVISAAGYGTRFLPETKTIQKEMLPVLDRPIIDYVVDDCIKAGISEIIFVIKSGDKQIKEYYSEDKNLYNYLERMRKLEKYKSVENLHTKAKFTYIEQPAAAPYGTATPIKLAKEFLHKEEAFLAFTGDDFVYNKDGSSEAARMIEAFNKNEVSALASFMEKPRKSLKKYGVAKYRGEGGNKYLVKLVEKPPTGEEPSNLANISKYIFTQSIFEALNHLELNKESGELYITDAIGKLAADKKVLVYTTVGEYVDCGNIGSWIKTNIKLALDRDDLKTDLQEYLRSIKNSI
jgi:UTP--glucose-1-phosphate uridylyltransferase